MKYILNGVELFNVYNDKEGIIFFESGDLYISKGSALPIKVEAIKSCVISQIGEFFHYYGKEPQFSASRIDFPNLTIKIMGTHLYFGQNSTIITFESVGPSELKKFGIWLKKQHDR